MKAYKGFKNDMTCRDFQYEEGKEYHEERALCCDTGFHACEYPLDCFKYYEPADSVYHEVEQTGDIDKSEGDSKVASTEIKIGAKIGIPGLVQAAIEYTSKRCEKKRKTTIPDTVEHPAIPDTVEHPAIPETVEHLSAQEKKVQVMQDA